MSKQRFKLIPAVYLILQKNGKILLLRRCNTGFEDGKYSLVAGHLNGNETVYQAMIREAHEEAGINININDLDLVHIMHRYNVKDAHEENGVKYPERLDFFITAKKWAGEINNMEPEKCDDLSWFDLNNLPTNMIFYIKKAINNIRKGIIYSEDGWS